MSILTDKLANTISHAGKEYPINTDFRVWLKFDSIMHNDAPPERKLEEIIKLCILPGELPPLEAVLQGLFLFYRAGDGLESENAEQKEPVFSYEYDSEYIYASFLQAYGIDLIDIPYLHWFKFQALLKSLPKETKLSKIISCRSADTSDIKDSKVKKAYEKLKRIYALPDSRSSEEKEHAFAEQLSRL